MAKYSDGMTIRGRVKLELFDKDGNLKDVREILNTITEAGDAHVADQLSASPDENAMSHMAIGTGTPTSTALGNEVHRNALTSRNQGSGADDNDVIYVGDFGAGEGTGAITEAGIFNSNSGGTMLASASFPTINKGDNDTLTITWTITYGSS